MNLRTSHGRAQAIADGGQAGELARIVEDALAAHSNRRESYAWEELNSVSIPNVAALLETTDNVLYLVRRGGPEDLDKVLKAAEAVKGQLVTMQRRLDRCERSVREAMQILQGE